MISFWGRWRYVIRNRLNMFVLCALCFALGACGFLSDTFESGNVNTEKAAYADSGSFMVSRAIPEQRNFSIPRNHTALLGFTPPVDGFVPQANEAWLEIDKSSKKITLYQGENSVSSFPGEGKVDLKSGRYSLQHKQKRPLWYAPDDYFTRRGLEVPSSGNRARYRRGALGQYVLYATTTFPIHSGQVWSDDVGGLKVANSDLASIYYMLPIGASVIVK